MPTYAYACTACDHRFEAQQAFTDDALTDCPQCEGRLRKLFHNVGIVFKGSGFYRTDSRTANGSPAASSDAGKESGKESGGGSSAKDSASSGGSGKEPASAASSSGTGGAAAGKGAAKATSAA